MPMFMFMWMSIGVSVSTGIITGRRLLARLSKQEKVRGQGGRDRGDDQDDDQGDFHIISTDHFISRTPTGTVCGCGAAAGTSPSATCTAGTWILCTRRIFCSRRT